MHRWIDPRPEDEPMPPQEKQPGAIDAGPQWIEPDTVHQWVDPDPVAEAMGPGVLQREGGDAREPWLTPRLPGGVDRARGPVLRPGEEGAVGGQPGRSRHGGVKEGQICGQRERVTPGQFRAPAKIAQKAASPAKKHPSDPLTISHEPRDSGLSNLRSGQERG
jgi:hypothetical protein